MTTAITLRTICESIAEQEMDFLLERAAIEIRSLALNEREDTTQEQDEADAAKLMADARADQSARVASYAASFAADFIDDDREEGGMHRLRLLAIITEGDLFDAEDYVVKVVAPGDLAFYEGDGMSGQAISRIWLRVEVWQDKS